MTSDAKLTMLKTFFDTDELPTDTVLNAYLDITKREIIAWRYGCSKHPDIAKSTNSNDVNVSVSAVVFISKITPTSGTSYVFTYSADGSSWQYSNADVELEDYGLTYPDYYSPVDAETITVKYNESYLAEFDMTQIMACVCGLGISGAEGQTANSENGNSRTWKYEDCIAYIRNHVSPCVGVI